MTILIKCRPPSALITQFEAPLWGNADPSVGERVFVWTAETQGGAGLISCGTITNIEPLGKHIRLTVSPDGRPIAATLGKAELAPYCYVNDGTPISSLSKKLYHHAWNKIVVIDGIEEEFLDQHFA